MTTSISKDQARKLFLMSQGLLTSNPFGKTKKSALATIQQLSYIQIDTISVIQRTHHHTLWARSPKYNPQTLHQLLEDKAVFEYWSHAAAYLPIKDFRFSLPRKALYLSGKSHWYDKDLKLMNKVLKRIQDEGPLHSKDFTSKTNSVKSGSWFDPKPTQKALAQLYMDGRIMIVKRNGMQKIYDVAERALPMNCDTSMPDQDEMADRLIFNYLNANGIGNATYISHLRRGWKKIITKRLKELSEAGKLEALSVNSVNGIQFATKEGLERLNKKSGPKQVHLLSPFDNAVILRDQLSQLFDFDYKLELYLPPTKRVYGYYSMPVLFGKQFVGRINLKADRKPKKLIVQDLYLNEGFKLSETFITLFTKKLIALRNFNDCKTIELRNIQPSSLKQNKTLDNLLRAEIAPQ